MRMLHDRKGDEELERSIAAIREQLTRAKQRVAGLYPGGRIRWVLETSEWVVIDVMTRERIEASRSLDELATRAPVSSKVPKSGTMTAAIKDEFRRASRRLRAPHS